ncbi:MAG: DNA polymerase III subunit gamma/tau [Candidatus Dependentiae bacterium]
MTTTSQNLNLARKWRSKTFDQLIGQNLCVKILKNSLYRGHYFPVYLFAGQRGCGKTSTARIFGAAINCEQLPSFQKDPRNVIVPCLECYSCRSMQQGNHPDFIEIDAASHTGVDNVRNIIDSSSFLPLMGRKKIYLIDEAHMLSRAAFNAFLKIMEEPPASVLFILATTDTQKIIETVRSRCFQLFFKPVENNSLHNHLATICEQEHISIDDDAIDCIINQTSGSVRDALNLLEQVRFSSARINKKSVLAVLGHIDDAYMVSLLDVVLYKNAADLLSYLQRIDFTNYNAERIWNRFVEVIRAAVWVKCGVQPNTFNEYIPSLKKIVTGCSIARLQELLQVLYEYEPLFLKTAAQHSLFEIALLRLCHKKNSTDSSSGSPLTASGIGEEIVIDDESEELSEEEDEQNDDEEETIAQFNSTHAWNRFVLEIEKVKDPLLTSIFKQGTLKEWHSLKSQLDVEFSKEFVFFKDWLQNATTIWMPLLQEQFGSSVIFNPMFTAAQKPKTINVSASQSTNVPVVNEQPKPKVLQNAAPKFNPVARTFKPKQKVSAPEAVVDVSDASLWKKSHILLKHFPGIVTEVKENQP